MVAYPDKVTCDRETFLYSKLEARHFILQEYKPLKGIINPGPIYEFKEIERQVWGITKRKLLHYMTHKCECYEFGINAIIFFFILKYKLPGRRPPIPGTDIFVFSIKS